MWTEVRTLLRIYCQPISYSHLLYALSSDSVVRVSHEYCIRVKQIVGIQH
jgi:hypothetical protein